jgi:hypothetical protein
MQRKQSADAPHAVLAFGRVNAILHALKERAATNADQFCRIDAGHGQALTQGGWVVFALGHNYSKGSNSMSMERNTMRFGG